MKLTSNRRRVWWLGAALLVCATPLATWAQPASQSGATAPRPTMSPSQKPPSGKVDANDPIAALLAKQVQPMVIGMRLGETKDTTRFVVELSDPVEAKVFTLTNPDRVVVDLPEVLWRMNADARPSGRGPVRSYRFGL